MQSTHGPLKRSAVTYKTNYALVHSRTTVTPTQSLVCSLMIALTHLGLPVSQQAQSQRFSSKIPKWNAAIVSLAHVLSKMSLLMS